MVEELRKILKELAKEFELNNIDAVIIGSTIVSLALSGFFKEEEDLDLFVINRSPLLEEDLFKNIAISKGWDYTYTDYGTPRLIVPFEYGEFFIDFYENIHDFYIPEEILEKETRRIKINHYRIKLLSLEAYIVLKARIGRRIDDRDLARIKELIKEGYLKVNKRKIEELLKYFPEEEIGIMKNRLARRELI
ncbi:MAG: nucleotidyltransferase [Thermoprotei archaeon]|nr:MAG: nucleotidyltransferase [Thermoprotei archaeon]